MSLKIRLDTLGENHPDVATSYYNIAIVYNSKGDYDNALDYFNKALTIYKSALGDSHPDVADTRNNVKLLQEQMENL
jgi:tetratricopeptide (TPR) repeat protein